MHTQKRIIILIMATLLLLAKAYAQNTEFWVGDSAGNPITQVNASLNEEFTLSVWMTNDYFTKATEILFAYDMCTARGEQAVKLHSKVAFISVSYFDVAGYFTNKYPSTWYGGAYRVTDTEVRPGGFCLPMCDLVASGPFTNARICNITLKNIGIPKGQEYYVGLWNARPEATIGSTYCTMSGTTSRYRDSDVSDPYNPALGPGTGWAVRVVNPIIGNEPGIVDGQIELGSFGGNLSLAPIKIELMQNDVVIQTTEVRLTSNPGEFSLGDVAPGTYDIAFQACQWLKKVARDVVVPPAGHVALDITLINGDVDGDNVLTVGDAGIILWNENLEGG